MSNANELSYLAGTVAALQAQVGVLTAGGSGGGLTGNTVSNVPITLFTLPGNGMYLVYISLDGLNVIADYGAYAVILKEGTSQKIIHQVDASTAWITLSGANVQGTQNSGGTFPIRYAYVRIFA
jgi:hypothetical protein